ncbi:MAG: preprotein translocase subunit SecG [Patescibacteria group bacterium]|mgnify:FL=1
MKTWLTVAQIVTGILLTGLVLLQAKGTGLGRAFGSIAYHSKRGVEKMVFRSTVIIAVIFVILSVLNVLTF